MVVFVNVATFVVVAIFVTIFSREKELRIRVSIVVFWTLRREQGLIDKAHKANDAVRP